MVESMHPICKHCSSVLKSYAKFLSIAHLVGFALKLRNLGVSDHGLIREVSVQWIPGKIVFNQTN